MLHPMRFCDPYLTRFLQPDSIIPDEYNPQSLNRYSYVNNSPINYTDPTGHWRVEDTGSKSGCSDPKYCKNGNPNPTKYWKVSVEEAIRERHVSLEGTTATLQREGFWIRKLQNAGKCPLSCVGDAKELMYYYDYNERFTVTDFDPKKINVGNVLLDAIGIPLGFVGVGGNPFKIGNNSLKILQDVGLADSGLSFIRAHEQNDKLGQLLAAGSALPQIGGFVSVGALGADLMKGWYQHEYVPPIPYP